MHIDHRGWALVRRLVLLAGIGLLGLVSIVGSGGGSMGFPPCDPPLCGGPEALAVSIEPADSTVMVGEAVTFVAVQSSNYGNFSYQWRRSADAGANYADIAGAVGSSYRLSSVNLADDGAMFMVVVRTGDSLTSQAVAHLAISSTPPRVYQDGDFDLAGWSVQPWVAAGTPAFSPIVERLASGGNPDAFMQTRLTMPSGRGSAMTLYLSNSAAHDPSVDGAIRSIDYAEDCAAVLRGTVTTVQGMLLIEQGGRRFVSPAPSVACVSSTWKPVSNRSGLRANDFAQIDGPACAAAQVCPDFSATAAPVRLGFARITSSYPGEASADGIDNWKVSVWRQ